MQINSEPTRRQLMDQVKLQLDEIERLRNKNAELVANLKRMLLEFDFLVERGAIPDVRNDIIFADARAAIAKVKGERNG